MSLDSLYYNTEGNKQLEKKAFILLLFMSKDDEDQKTKELQPLWIMSYNHNGIVIDIIIGIFIYTYLSPCLHAVISFLHFYQYLCLQTEKRNSALKNNIEQ